MSISASSVATQPVRSQSPCGDRRREPRSTGIDQFLGLLRQAMRDTDYSLEALASALEQGIGRHVDKAFLWRMLNGERPLPVAYLVALPRDMKVRMAQLTAEGFGLIVVRPSSAEHAAGQFVSGLLGLLAAERRSATVSGLTATGL